MFSSFIFKFLVCLPLRVIVFLNDHLILKVQLSPEMLQDNIEYWTHDYAVLFYADW